MILSDALFCDAVHRRRKCCWVYEGLISVLDVTRSVLLSWLFNTPSLVGFAFPKMGVLNRLRRPIGSSKSSNVDTTEMTTTTNHEKNGQSPEDGVNPVAEDGLPAEDVTEGVKNMEAITLVWTKKSLITLFICIWFVYLLNAFQSSTVGSLVPYVTSSWGAHSLLNVIDVVASSMTAAVFIPLAKLLDLWGRAEGYLLMVAFAELGLILMATSTNLSIYCAANVSYKSRVNKSPRDTNGDKRSSIKLASQASSIASMS
jgi:hypothetical protein